MRLASRFGRYNSIRREGGNEKSSLHYTRSQKAERSL